LFPGGVGITLPFLIADYRTALVVAFVAIAAELMTLAWIRWRYFNTGFIRSFVSITVGGALIAALGAAG
jgi:hypothetical protein